LFPLLFELDGPHELPMLESFFLFLIDGGMIEPFVDLLTDLVENQFCRPTCPGMRAPQHWELSPSQATA
jgi:hypothetical protein